MDFSHKRSGFKTSLHPDERGGGELFQGAAAGETVPWTSELNRFAVHAGDLDPAWRAVRISFTRPACSHERLRQVAARWADLER